jgi:uncharacterized protein YqkB
MTDDKAKELLTAAAPDMLEALKHAKDWLDELGCLCEVDCISRIWVGQAVLPCASCVVNAAIAKAEGRPHD